MKFIAFDTETGGLDSERSLLTVHFVVLDENFNKLDELSLALKPDDGVYSITGQALRVNKLNLGQHDASPETLTYKEAKPVLYNFLKANAQFGRLIPVGHNVAFDEDMIKAKLISAESWGQFVSYRRLDTGTIAQFLRICNIIPGNLSGSLGSLVNYFEVPQEKAHTAEGDTLMTIGVLKAMKEEVADE